MALDSDALIDRRRLKRRLAVWRLAAVIAIVGLVAVSIARTDTLPVGPYLAVLDVDGLILSDPYREQALADLADNGQAKALILHIDSPGGTTYGSEALYHAVRAVAATKPVVAVMSGVAASGGYMTAIAGDFIVARESTITGSIGVVMEATNFVGLMDLLGIETEAIKSGPLKAEPNPFSRMTPEVRAATQALIDDVHAMFVGMVAERRAMPLARAEALADGRVFTGRMALDAGLIDALGGEDEALAWLASERGIDTDLPMRDVEIAYPEKLVDRLVSAVTGKPYLLERLTLDGLMSLWHPSLGD